jgi:threonylcarbamoyladenosine tRNA methylthiotransferase MtaB
MNRRYSSSFYGGVIEKLMAAAPQACIGTDVIVGFQESRNKNSKIPITTLKLSLAYFHVFPFSPREKTPAAQMSEQVDVRVIKERAKALRKLSDVKKRTYYNSFLGKELAVLVQNRDAGGKLKGLAGNYVPVILDGGDSLLNTEVRVKVTDVTRDLVRGEVTG